MTVPNCGTPCESGRRRQLSKIAIAGCDALDEINLQRPLLSAAIDSLCDDRLDCTERVERADLMLVHYRDLVGGVREEYYPQFEAVMRVNRPLSQPGLKAPVAAS